MAKSLRVAFIKFGGLAAGGTERWLQMMAAGLPTDRFTVDYFYCDAAPYVGSDFQHPDTDPARVAFMEEAGVNLIKFKVGAKDLTTPTHEWRETDFWERFDPSCYDLVQTATAGPAEYPYNLIELPLVEYVTLSAGVNKSKNVALSIHLSQWQRRRWAASGGDLTRSCVIPIPGIAPATSSDLREQLKIPADALVAGFHQRAQDEIFSPIPLQAFADVCAEDRWFVIMGGSHRYRDQAASLGLERVLFVDHDGGAQKISEFLNTLDLFAHGRADGETFGTVLAEAMMHGKPCLSHRSPVANAQPETMGPAGLFAEDERDYAAKLELLYSNEVLSHRLAAKARPHAERYYSLDSCLSELADAYDGVAGRDAPRAEQRPVAYGECDLGFLLAGNLEDPRSVAHCVLTGGVPQDPVAGLVAALVEPGSSYREVGSANSALAIVAATAGASCVCDVTIGSGMDALNATAGLNNLEDRVEVREYEALAELEMQELCRSALLVINDPAVGLSLAPRLATATVDETPVLLFRSSGPEPPLAELAGRGYRRFSVRGSDWVLWLHDDQHRGALEARSRWLAGRRRAFIRRVAQLPANRLRKLRRRLGGYYVNRQLPWRGR